MSGETGGSRGLSLEQQRDLAQLERLAFSGMSQQSDVATLKTYWFAGTAQDRQRIDRVMECLRSKRAIGAGS